MKRGGGRKFYPQKSTKKKYKKKVQKKYKKKYKKSTKKVQMSSTITAKQRTYFFLLKKLHDYSFVLLCYLQKQFCAHESKNQMPELILVAKKRADVEEALENEETFERFERTMMQEEPELERTIQETLKAAVSLACSTDIFQDKPLPNALRVLYAFLLRVCRERPVLIMQEDDKNGSFVNFLKESMEGFIAANLHF